MIKFFTNKLATIAVVVSIMAGVAAVYTGNELSHNQKRYDTAVSMREIDQHIFNGLLDAETGQRGFLITGNESYLDAYRRGETIVPKSLSDYAALELDADQQQFVNDIKPLVAKKLNELDRTVELRRKYGFAEAAKVVMTDEGKAYMSELRTLFLAERDRNKTLRAILCSQTSILTQGTLYLLLLCATALITAWVAVTRR